jgi:hypothetical protein
MQFFKNILTLDQISDELQDRKLSVVSKATKLSVGTLNKLKKGEETNYTIETLKVISDYINKQKQK